jgi:hypothetical protein
MATRSTNFAAVPKPAGLQVELGLAFGTLAERVASEIDLLAVISPPEHRVSMLA